MSDGQSQSEGEPLVIVEADGPVLSVTLNRPEKRNATNAEVLCRLFDAWVRLDTDPSLRVGILTGRGSTFCAGMDLAEIGRLNSGVADNPWIVRLREDSRVIFGVFLKTFRPSKPIILAAEGYARAGGTEILQGTDIRVAGESAVFGVTEVQRGLFPMAGSTVRLPRQIGYAVAAEMLLTGDDIERAKSAPAGSHQPRGSRWTGPAARPRDCGPNRGQWSARRRGHPADHPRDGSDARSRGVRH